MAGIVVDFLVGKLKEPAFQEITFQLGIKAEIEKITTRLENMKGYVEHLGRGKQDSNRAENWVNQLRDTSLELEDLVEEFMLDTKLLELNTSPCDFCQVKSLVATVQSFAKKVKMQFCFHQKLKAIDETLVILEEDKSKCKIELRTNVENNDQLLGSGSGYIEGMETVGKDMEFKQIADVIEKCGDHMKVITIWGAGGSGKTTLAKIVYERLKNDGTVDCFSWVEVNQSSDIEYVLRTAINGIYLNIGTKPPQELKTANRNFLQQHILDYLEGKRYVLFFDDVWDQKLLSHIKIPSNCASSIIITSRDKNIAVGSFLGAAPHYVEVKPLEFDSACSLFCKLAFCNNSGASAGGGTRSWPNDMIKELGEVLVEKCSGLPVAILALARLMCTKGDDPAKWRDALKSLNSEFEGSLASLNRALLLSYNELPTHLKSCFLYCAIMLPKTHDIGVEELIRLCIAEGFVNNEEVHGGRAPEDIAWGYFLQLKNRSLLQIVDEEFGEEVGRIQMHDLYRDVACQVIRREMFAEVVLEQNTKVEWKQRRLMILEGEATVKLDNYENMKKLRTLLINSKRIALSTSLPQMLQNLKLLRVLVLEWMPYGMEELPTEVGDLIHLRYIGLKGKISHLPESLGRLHNLQTLDICGSYVTNLPKCVSELRELRHLIGNELEVPDIVFTFSQLRTLCGIRINTINQAREIVHIKQLTVLRIQFEGVECLRAICASVEEMTNLRSLLIISTEDDISWEFPNFSPPLFLESLFFMDFHKLAKFTSTPNYLRVIVLGSCSVDVDFFSSLEKLPSLVLLSIDSYMGEKLLCSAGSFPRLKKLDIVCPKVTKWEIGKEAMKGVESLAMQQCKCLKMLPEGLKEVEYLKELHLSLPSQELVQRISVGGADRWKVKHIPRVTICRNDDEKPFLLS